MKRVMNAQLGRFLRPRTAIVVALAALAFGLVATLSVFSSPSVADTVGRRGGAPLATLTGTGGGTEAFAIAASFAGFLVFVSVIALVASEFSGGTFRALVLRQPHRIRVIVLNPGLWRGLRSRLCHKARTAPEVPVLSCGKRNCRRKSFSRATPCAFF